MAGKEISEEERQRIARDLEIVRLSSEGKLSSSEIAQRVGLDRGSVNRILRSHGISRAKEYSEKVAKIKKAINLGKFSTIKEVAQHTGIPPKTVSKAVKEMGISIPLKIVETKGSFVGQRFGLWEVLEYETGGRGIGTIYKCLCHGCNKTYPVKKRNLRDGLSKGCIKCGTKKQGVTPVGNSNGDRFESVQAAARAFNVHGNLIRTAIHKGKQLKGVSWFLLDSDD